jgi:hypothetical protein
VVRLLGRFNNFVLEQGLMSVHRVWGGLFCFLKYDISWVSSFLQQRVNKP